MPSATLPQLQKQIAALQAKIDALKQKEAGGVIVRIKEAIAQYGLTAADLGLSRQGRTLPAVPTAASKPARRRRTVGKIRYRDAAGNSWTGRGRRPMWFVDALAAGKTREDMQV